MFTRHIAQAVHNTVNMHPS